MVYDMSNYTRKSDIKKPRTVDNHRSTIKFLDIVKNESLLLQFPKYTFPATEIMSDGTAFMDTTRMLIEPGSQTFIKWLILNKKASPVHDWDYPYTRLPNEGYILKLKVPVVSDKLNKLQFHVSYAININEIEIVRQDSLLKRDITDTQTEVETESFLLIDSYDVTSDIASVINPLITSPTFFDEYLKNYFYDMTDR